PHRPGLFVGTELAATWGEMSIRNLLDLAILGAQVIPSKKFPLLTKGVAYVLEGDPSRLGRAFHLVTWLKPYVASCAQESSMRAIAFALPFILDGHGALVMAFVQTQRPHMYLHLLNPLIEFTAKSGAPMKMSLVPFDPDLRLADAHTTAENLAHGGLLHPDQRQTEPLKVLVEMGVDDPRRDLYLHPKKSFLDVFRSILEIELSFADGVRHADLSLVFGRIFIEEIYDAVQRAHESQKLSNKTMEAAA